LFGPLASELANDGRRRADSANQRVKLNSPLPRPRFTLRVVLAVMAIVAVIGWGMGKGPPSDGVLWIATNLQDVPAEIIAEVYRQR
jgi:hypothetical protein